MLNWCILLHTKTNSAVHSGIMQGLNQQSQGQSCQPVPPNYETYFPGNQNQDRSFPKLSQPTLLLF